MYVLYKRELVTFIIRSFPGHVLGGFWMQKSTPTYLKQVSMIKSAHFEGGINCAFYLSAAFQNINVKLSI